MRLAVSFLACALIGAGTVACAGRPAGSGADCMLTAGDSVHLASGPVYRECGVDRVAELDARSVQLELLPAALLPGAGTAGCLRAEVELVVGEDGLPERGTWRLMSANQPLYGDAVMKSVPGWRYRPAELGGRPVRQIVREKRYSVVRVMAVRESGAVPAPPGPPNC